MDNLDFNISEKKNNDIYFSNEQTQARTQQPPKAKAPVKKVQKQRGAGSTYLFFIVVIVISMIVSIYAILCMNDILAITKTKSTVTVTYTETIEDSDEAVALLKKNGLITCKNFCKVFVKLRDGLMSSNKLGGPYEAGVYYLNGKMGLEGMLVTLMNEQQSSETVTLTFPEGYTVPEIVNKLSDNDVCDKSALLSVIQTTEYQLPLVSDLKASDSIPYRLEGYLFPDTYEFFIDESASSVIRKFLDNGNTKFKEDYKKKAQEMGYSTKDIIIIASIIQKEAANEDQMKTISAVIHNRLKDTVNFPTLGCQSTADYITNKVSPALSSTSSHTADYYMAYYDTNNTSTVVGLPAGPICNPGVSAIKAALYPAKSDAKYFFHDTNGTMYTAKSYTEFKQKVATYAPYLEY